MASLVLVRTQVLYIKLNISFNWWAMIPFIWLMYDIGEGGGVKFEWYLETTWNRFQSVVCCVDPMDATGWHLLPKHTYPTQNPNPCLSNVTRAPGARSFLSANTPPATPERIRPHRARGFSRRLAACYGAKVRRSEKEADPPLQIPTQITVPRLSSLAFIIQTIK